MTTQDTSADAGRVLTAGERLEYDITNTPVPDGTDQYLVCAWAFE
jgi:hypothetical protein